MFIDGIIILILTSRKWSGLLKRTTKSLNTIRSMVIVGLRLQSIWKVVLIIILRIIITLHLKEKWNKELAKQGSSNFITVNRGNLSRKLLLNIKWIRHDMLDTHTIFSHNQQSASWMKQGKMVMVHHLVPIYCLMKKSMNTINITILNKSSLFRGIWWQISKKSRMVMLIIEVLGTGPSSSKEFSIAQKLKLNQPILWWITSAKVLK